MLAAISEAAFITGMERNSDLVKMTSYAPLFENSNDRTWPVNLIWINSTQVIGRSSYYVQKFMADGKVGAGTWITQAEYKDFKISATGGNVDKPVIREMEKLNDEWTITESSAAQTSDKTMTALMCNKVFSGSYTLELKARKTGGAEGFLIYFGMSDQNKKGYLVNIGGWLNTKTAIETIQGGSNSVVSEMPAQHIETGKWYDIKVAVTNEGVGLWVLMFFSCAVTAIFFTQLLTSVWCFFAALISGVIFWILRDSKRQFKLDKLKLLKEEYIDPLIDKIEKQLMPDRAKYYP